MWSVIDTAVVSSRYSADWAEAILKARLLLRYCSYSGHIPVEGQSSDTFCTVACIERIKVMYGLVEDLVLGGIEGCQ